MNPLPSPLHLLPDHPGRGAGITLYLKRDDLLHATVPGNKWRKLEPVVQMIQDQQYTGILTWGGPFSNHLQAVAAAGQAFGFPTVGVVRGLAANLGNPTLAAALADGMQLFPVSKHLYDDKENSPWLQELAARFPDFYHLPAGGATPAAVHNCQAIASEILAQLPPEQLRSLMVCVPAGTGCTAAGVIAGLGNAGRTWLFPAVDHGVEEAVILGFLSSFKLPATSDFQIIRDYTFGGFASPDPLLMDFVRHFKMQTGILLDPIYTAKMMFGVYDLLAKGAFPAGSTVVAVHTGGLQGWAGFRERFGLAPEQW